MTIQATKDGSILVVDVNHDNTSQEVISITNDKLKLILIEHLSRVESAKAWQMPLSLFITIVLVFCTADFKLAFGISADTWRAVFIICGFISLIWLIYCLRKIQRSKTVDDVMDIVKNITNN